MDVEAAIRERVRERRIRVPPAPSACLQLANLLSHDDWSVTELDRIVRADPAITAVVLRAANGVGVRGREPITTIPGAVSRLGARGVLKLAWASAAAHTATATGPLLSLRQRAWREALVAAHVAQWLAKPGPGRVAPFDPETAYVVGMLHDIGRIVACSALEDLFAQHPEADTRTAAGWWALIEDLHQAAGGALVEAWQLPHPLAAAVAFHHQLGAWDWLQTVNEVVAQVEGTPHVTPDTLGSIAALDTATCLDLARRLPELVDAIRLVDPALPQVDANASPWELDAVHVSTGDETTSGALISADDAGLLVSLTEPLKTRLVVFVRVAQLQFHAQVEVAGEYTRLKPWALDAAQAQAMLEWRASLRRAA
ncbi:MAG: HDOD domain-containing protein [Archangiaceae bacterium]|nr:HDOD domain-containing protein [Archangiaceae bacterium]